MDPYLESPNLWPDVHNRLINIFAEQLSPLLAPKYVAELETQIAIDRMPKTDTQVVLPDVTITETDGLVGDTDTAVAIAPAPLHLTIPVAVRTRLTSIYIRRIEGEKLVTVLELLLPINKRSGKERQKYLKKRNDFFDSEVHLIEIDLLRKWPRIPLGEPLPKTDYLAIVSNAYERPSCSVWPIKLRQSLPVLPVPLLPPDPDVPLDLGAALRTAYERARYDLRINYNASPVPPLKHEDAAWAATLVNDVQGMSCNAPYGKKEA
jgi:hypothetical protein